MKVSLCTGFLSNIQKNLNRFISAKLKALREYVKNKGYSIQKEYFEPIEESVYSNGNREKFNQFNPSIK